MKPQEEIAVLRYQLSISQEQVRLLGRQLDELNVLLSEVRAENKENQKLMRGYLMQIAELTKSVASLEKALTLKDESLQKKENRIKGMVALLNNKSEKVKGDQYSSDLADAATSDARGAVSKPAYVPKDRGNNGAKRNMHLEMEEVTLDFLPEDEGFDKDNARVAYRHTTVRYVYQPPRIIKQIITHNSYSCNGKLYEAKVQTPLLNSSFDGSFIAFLAEYRYMYSLPVERIVQILNNNGFEITKSTANGLLQKTASLFENLYKALEQAVLSDSYLGCDETYMKVMLQEPNDNGKHIKKGYIWDIIAKNLNLMYFFYDKGSRSKDVVFDKLRNYSGTIQSDAFAPYKTLGSDAFPNITRIPCLQHIKRKFKELEGDPDADKIFEILNKFYYFDHRPPKKKKQWTETDQLEWRRQYSSKVFKELAKETARIKAAPDYIKRTYLSKAITSLENELDDMRKLFTSGTYTLDNNIVECYNRAISTSRRNSLFFGSHSGAEKGAIFYSLACSCKLQGINFFEYITDVLNTCAAWPPNTPIEKYREYLPDEWKKKHILSDK